MFPPSRHTPAKAHRPQESECAPGEDNPKKNKSDHSLFSTNFSIESIKSPVAINAEVRHGLEIQDWVKVRSKEEIEATLNVWRQLKGCMFMPEMLPYCNTSNVYSGRSKDLSMSGTIVSNRPMESCCWRGSIARAHPITAAATGLVSIFGGKSGWKKLMPRRARKSFGKTEGYLSEIRRRLGPEASCPRRLRLQPYGCGPHRSNSTKYLRGFP